MTNSGLNAPQQAAVEHFTSPLLVLAGAGSGKTRVITEKIVRLIRNQRLPARYIAAITFTNKAAREMQARVKTLLSKEEARGLNVSTFHTLGLKIIRQELKTLGYKPGFSIFDAQDSGTLLKELARKDNLEEDDAARWQISSWKNAFTSPQQALSSAEDEKMAYHARLYERYQRQLQAYNAMDFDDLIVLPVQLLESQPQIREKWQNRLRYLLIDEYQDTNACQYRLVKLLTGIEGRFTVVGDDDQSIYAWRGAQPENLALLSKDFPTLKIIKLEQNYRSTTHILDAANQLIARNPHVFEKRLWSALGEGRKLQVMPCSSAEMEVQNVISEILRLKFKHRTLYHDFAILYRGNHQSRLFESKLREQNIPYKVSGGTSFFARAEIKDIIGYLRLLTNPDDDTAFLRIVNTPRREIGAATLEKLGEYATQRESSLFSASFEMGLTEKLSGRALMRLQRFTDWVRELSVQVDDMDAAAV
ncbi:MAG TPA: ATP-dependent DNA helicase Rep, partial [Gammaproteobacteria bacterium]|nr:ATP-dependent DNA helicase Rep [Gammaproteobacteria bacterium]